MDPIKYPRSLDEKGEIIYTGLNTWTMGFYPGILWYFYELTNNQEFLKFAKLYTEALEAKKNDSSTHDLGFIIYNSFGNGYRITKNEKYAQILLASANTLAKRFDPILGMIKSYDKPFYEFPVIVDNLVNLELLFWAASFTGNQKYSLIAEQHAINTIKNHKKTNNSYYQLVDFDSLSGEIMVKGNLQAYNQQSIWTRGQAWALYGLTICFRETGNKIFLENAIDVADYIYHEMYNNCDFVPYWDFSLYKIKNEKVLYKDASAAAIIASALIELSDFTSGTLHTKYFNLAMKILHELSSQEFFIIKGNNPFILDHSVGDFKNSIEVDVPLIYADYYYLEALYRLK